MPAEQRLPEPYWHAAGFQLAGTRAVRIDMLERLSDLIRARVGFRTARAEAEIGGEPPRTRLATADAKEAPPIKVPSGAIGDGSFRASPELMSVVGCSGEDFASILQALGFRRERRKVAPPAEIAARRRADACLRRDLAPRQTQGWAPREIQARRRASLGGKRAVPMASIIALPSRAPKSGKGRAPPTAARPSPCSPSFAATLLRGARKEADGRTMPGQRLDKWLWCARLVRTRVLAAKLIADGKVRVNGMRVLKLARRVRQGDVVTATAGGRLFVVRVAGEAERRGPASTAKSAL